MSDHAIPPSGPYAELTQALREAAVLQSACAVLGWDQETYMPPKGAALRAEQRASLSGLAHERRTSPRVGELLAACEADPSLTADPEAAANLREMRRDFDRATRLPAELVRRFAEAGAHAMHAWRDARDQDDFARFAPWLETMTALSVERAQALGWPEGGEPYDALLEEFEPGMTTAEIRRTFAALRAGLAPLIRAVADAPARPDTGPWRRLRVPVDRQAAFTLSLVEKLGFDLQAGRLDVSAHPFCDSFGPGDTRFTTRYAEDQLPRTLSGALHETGHALYEQNLPKCERFGQPLGEAVSMGIHESQSRMWENMVGRSRPFCEWVLPLMREALGTPEVRALDAETVYRGVNVVEPTLIRVESDEATYNLHIMLRFDLERALLSGNLAGADLPGAWNERVRCDLGLEVPDDARGCLQDIHWSVGSFGYFPTYTLGNLYAAQLWSTVHAELPELDDDIRRGGFGGLLEWLRRNLFVHGRRYTAPELCERITGRRLSHEPLLRHLADKLGPIYGI